MHVVNYSSVEGSAVALWAADETAGDPAASSKDTAVILGRISFENVCFG